MVLMKGSGIKSAPMIVVSFLLLAGTVTFYDMKKIEERLGSVSPVEFTRSLASESDLILIDVRTVEEFEDDHISGAINIDYESEEFANKILNLDRNSFYAVYCQRGRRSKETLDFMVLNNFRRVIDLYGGIEALANDKEALEYLQ